MAKNFEALNLWIYLIIIQCQNANQDKVYRPIYIFDYFFINGEDKEFNGTSDINQK